jgi:DNA helicase-2/ATP-dependent DNA helicase PcrA
MKEIGSELVEKHDNAAAMKQQLEEADKSVTEVRSATLQQQLARSKKTASTPQEAVTYTAGEKVSHSIFGEGVIVSVKPMANDSMLEIAFDKVGTKKIMANYAKLKKL